MSFWRSIQSLFIYKFTCHTRYLQNSFMASHSPSLFSHRGSPEGERTGFLFSGRIQILVHGRSRNQHRVTLGTEGLFEQRMWYHKQSKWDLKSLVATKLLKIYISSIYFGAGVSWVGCGGGIDGCRNPVDELAQRWEWKEPIIALWRIKTTSANSPNICVVPQSGSFTASGFPVQINSAEVYKGRTPPPPPHPRGEAHPLVLPNLGHSLLSRMKSGSVCVRVFTR